jgi:hypothetical protein
MTLFGVSPNHIKNCFLSGKIMKIIIISILASFCCSLFAEITPLELEELYLEQRASLLTEKRDT